jgi:hypothetical protein
MLSALTAAPVVPQADAYLPDAVKVEVEIGPAQFIVLEQWDWTVDDAKNKSGEERTRLKLRYGDQEVVWEGREIPVVLREKADKLYMIGYDRETGRLSGDDIERYSYFQLEKGVFRSIPRDDFPKELATQNMWLREPKRLQAVLKLDTADPCFWDSVNAAIWEHLMTGEVTGNRVDKRILDEFKEKYKPIELTEIKRDGTKK